MYLLLAFDYRWIPWRILPLIPFSVVNNISIWVNWSNFILLFFKAAYHANSGAARKRAGSSSYISRHIFRKFSNTSANSNVLLWTYKSWYSPKFLFEKFYNNSFACTESALVISSIFRWMLEYFFSGNDFSSNFSQSSMYL